MKQLYCSRGKATLAALSSLGTRCDATGEGASPGSLKRREVPDGSTLPRQGVEYEERRGG
jgi:hypothetical protein